jgi:hypothetical protein
MVRCSHDSSLPHAYPADNAPVFRKYGFADAPAIRIQRLIRTGLAAVILTKFSVDENISVWHL